MKYFLISFILLITAVQAVAQSKSTGFYAGPGIGYSRYVNDQLKGKSAVAAGPRFGIVGGYNFGEVALESFYNSTKTKTNEKEFEGNKYVFHADMKSFGILGKYFIHLMHIRLGYAIHNFNFAVTSYPSGALVEDIRVKEDFGATGKNRYYGPLFGIGADFPIGPLSPYVVITSYQLNNTNADIMELELGLKISF